MYCSFIQAYNGVRLFGSGDYFRHSVYSLNQASTTKAITPRVIGLLTYASNLRCFVAKRENKKKKIFAFLRRLAFRIQGLSPNMKNSFHKVGHAKGVICIFGRLKKIYKNVLLLKVEPYYKLMRAYCAHDIIKVHFFRQGRPQLAAVSEWECILFCALFHKTPGGAP